jgi:hypothetical protein
VGMELIDDEEFTLILQMYEDCSNVGSRKRSYCKKYYKLLQQEIQPIKDSI